MLKNSRECNILKFKTEHREINSAVSGGFHHQVQVILLFYNPLLNASIFEDWGVFEGRVEEGVETVETGEVTLFTAVRKFIIYTLDVFG